MDISSYKRNVILTTTSVFLLLGCGPSPEEIAEQERLAEEARIEQERLEIEAAFAEQKRRNDLATITCNIMGESRNMDAAMRIKEINSSRERLGEDLYLGTDEGIKQSFEYGLCRELVLNDPEYNSKLLSIMKAIAEQEAEAAERRRVAAEKRAEEARIAQEKAEEEARIAAEKKAIETKKNIKTWSENIKKVLNDYPIEANLTYATFEFGALEERETIEYFHTCKNLKGLTFDTVFVFKNNRGEIRKKGSSIGSCPSLYETLQNYPSLYQTFPEQVVDLFYEGKLPSEEVFESVYIELTGDIYWNYYSDNFKDPKTKREIEKIVKKENYNLPYNAKFDPAIVKTKYQIYP